MDAKDLKTGFGIVPQSEQTVTEIKKPQVRICDVCGGPLGPRAKFVCQARPCQIENIMRMATRKRILKNPEKYKTLFYRYIYFAKQNGWIEEAKKLGKL